MGNEPAMSRGARLGLLVLMVLVLVAGHLLDRELGREDSGRPGTLGAGLAAELPLDLTDRLPPARPPQVRGSPLPPSDAAAQGGDRTYIVKPGDTFATIARTVYGRESAWKVIYDANRDRVATPARLQVGITLRIPPAPPPAMRPGG